MMIAAYRAERLSQRPAPRASPRQHHVARHPPVAPHAPGQPEAPPAEPAVAVVAAAASASVFANLVSLADAGRHAAEAGRDTGTGASHAATPATETPAVETSPAPASIGAPDAPGDGRPVAAVSPDRAIPLAPSLDGPNLAGPIPAEPMAHDPQASDPPTKDPPVNDPPLAEIGFGPGMLIRLSQLGLHTTTDLARADAGQLRVALGDISRLVDVETWISHARQTARG
jgi:hypothetical protein